MADSSAPYSYDFRRRRGPAKSGALRQSTLIKSTISAAGWFSIMFVVCSSPENRSPCT
ncbi:hypothetical protein PISMIDRAFT_686588 [Pisolithus microcarpus 441]|uniref:Uncharacterized protein n=1 Tax=Pisolithus microcarpus 441 TaxID=765257 RepID=A0A0C9YQU6_9AGAM|nr:hypothetical protein PISMIDRAFT_686588 [Pisolithus microcarpus 441]